jgi:hypothetical protein
MSLWLTIPLGVGIIAAVIAVARRSEPAGIYIGIVERDVATGTDRDCLHVRVYVDETLVHALAAPSKLTKLTGWMVIRETDTSVPLMFVRVPPYVSLRSEQSDEWHERMDMPIRPVIFGFDPMPDLTVHPGQLVDVCIGEQR